jgi:Amt family ammonium transporter
LAAIGITIGLAVVGTLALLKIVDLLVGVRVSEEQEIEGLDLSQHGEEGYSTDLDLMPAGNALTTHQAAVESLATTVPIEAS